MSRNQTLGLAVVLVGLVSSCGTSERDVETSVAGEIIAVGDLPIAAGVEGDLPLIESFVPTTTAPAVAASVTSTPTPTVIPACVGFRVTAASFGVNSDGLTADAEADIARIAAEIVSEGAVVVDVVGHTDRRGSTELNERLSAGRAEAVETALEETPGLAPLLRDVIGVGSAQLLDVGDNEAAHARNRRVEILVNCEAG